VVRLQQKPDHPDEYSTLYAHSAENTTVYKFNQLNKNGKIRVSELQNT